MPFFVFKQISPYFLTNSSLHNVEVELNFNNDCQLSSKVDAKLIRFIKMLDPFHDVKIYRDLKNNVLKDVK